MSDDIVKKPKKSRSKQQILPPSDGFISTTVYPESPHWQNTFSTVRQGTSTNSLTKAKATKTNTRVDLITGTANLISGNFTVTMPSFEILTDIKTSTHKLLDAITVAFTERGAKSSNVALSLSDYMAQCGLKDRKQARKQAEEDLETLFNMRISFKEKLKHENFRDYIDIRLCEAKGIRNGLIYFKFTESFFNILLGYPVMPYPHQLWRLNAKYNPNSYYFLRKISEHKNMNFGKKNADTISVQTLLDSSPFIPTYEEVMESNRHLSERIIEPFERDMNVLNETLTWHYCHRNDGPLTDLELINFDYETFINLLVKISWRVYPERIV